MSKETTELLNKKIFYRKPKNENQKIEKQRKQNQKEKIKIGLYQIHS